MFILLRIAHPHTRFRRVFQRHHGSEWIGKVEYSRCDMFRLRYHQYAIGKLLMLQTWKGSS